MHRAAERCAFPPTRCLQCAVAASLGRYAAPGKHVVRASPQPAASSSAFKRIVPDPPPPPPSPTFLQRHKGFIYATAHVRDVDSRFEIRDPGEAAKYCKLDGDVPVGIDAGFEVAPGDPSDVEVANAHTWQCYCLVFSDGTKVYTALSIARVPLNMGTACSFCK